MTTNTLAANLRPRGMGELLDQAVRLYRANFLKFIGIIALVEIPVGLLQILSSTFMINGLVNFSNYTSSNPESIPGLDYTLQMLGGSGGMIVVGILSFFLVSGVGTAALTRAIADGYLGEPVDILGSYRKIGKRWLSLLGALLLLMLISLGAVIWLIIPCAGWLTGPGFLMFLTMVLTPLLGPIVVLENAPAAAAIRRAWDLARARFWWLMGYMGILVAFNLLLISGPIYVLNFLIVSPLQREVMSLGSSQMTFITAFIAEQGLSTLLSILYVSLQATAITLAYFDLRMRLEGFDLAIQTLSPDQSITEQITQAPQAQNTSKLITWNDVLHFFLLSLIAVAVYGFFMAIGMAASLGSTGLSAFQ
ncbi:MAG: hypothetical protein AB9891_06820 [Anaerolineaceae bacterium]